MQQTAGCHTCMRPVTCGDPGDGPKADRVSWPIVSIPDVGDGVSWRSADFSAQSRGAPRWVAGSPGVWLSVTPCPAIIARPGWPAVVTPPSAPRSLMGRGQVQAYGTCPLQNEHESAPDLVRRIRQSARHQESGWRADHWMRRTSRIGPNASSCSTSGHGVVSRQRPRGARPSMPDRCYTDVAEIRTAAGPSSAVQCVFNGGPYTTASQVRQCQLVCPPPPCPRQATCPTRTWSRAKRVTGFPHDAATSGSGRRVS